MRGGSKPQNLNVKRRDLGQFVEKVSDSFVNREENKNDSINNQSSTNH